MPREIFVPGKGWVKENEMRDDRRVTGMAMIFDGTHAKLDREDDLIPSIQQTIREAGMPPLLGARVPHPLELMSWDPIDWPQEDEDDA